MKILFSILTFLGLLILGDTDSLDSEDFKAVLTVNQTEFARGTMPKFNVRLDNLSDQSLYLPGSLDGSDVKLRYPQVYFVVERPDTSALPFIGRCGNTNPIRPTDFIKLNPKEGFDPYNSENGFFSSFQLHRPEVFSKPGKYKVTFYYSTKSTDINDYAGDLGPDITDPQLLIRFKKMPHIELISNTIEFEIMD
ncbi:hypothetical protein GYB22_01355 [bacterium]|nr:hypothetical protein [bacterium]